MLNIGIVGLGKMGISHFGILKAHPKVNLCAVTDPAKMVTWGLNKYSGVNTYSKFEKMITKEKLDAVFLATPTKFHAEHIEIALENNLHVFVEKPFCLDANDSRAVTEEAEKKGLVTQVGYHNRFIGTFLRAKECIDKGFIGNVYNIHGEAYGPVITKKQKESWRSKKSEGGGCVYDYSSHVINLMEFFVGKAEKVDSAILQNIFSAGTEDAVFANFIYQGNKTGRLTVNWSDETYRKMVTSITIMGDAGKIVVNAQELRIFLKNDVEDASLEQGWNVSYLTDHSIPVDFYLRGEEYSAQIDSFVNAIESKNINNVNSFGSALNTDLTISEIFDVANKVG
jgi:predicted dehydrogenase